MTDPEVHLAARVQKSLVDELRALAAKNDRSVSAELRIAIRQHLRHEREKAAA